MKTLKFLSCWFVFCLLSLGLAANAVAHEGKVVKLSGFAEVLLPGATAGVPVTPGMAIPQGATITTGKDGQVFLETANGVVAAIQGESKVIVEKLEIKVEDGRETLREALLELKQGNIVSTLDPSKKAINKYGVRTPKGVAAARGTVYGVSVNISGTSVATLTGIVTLDLGNGVKVDIPLGSGVMNNSETVSSLAAAIAASGQEGLSVSQLLQEAVQVVADNVAANTSAAGGSATATSVMAAVVSAASAAQPEQAANFTKTAVAAVTSSASATGGSAESVAAAVNAVTEAAVRAAPAQTTEIAQSSAAAVVETKVTEAVNAAKASGGDTTAAAAAAQTEAAAVVATVAQTAVNAAAAVGTTVSVDSVATAVNTGATQGSTSAGTTTQTTVPTAPTVPAPAAPSPEAPAPSAPIVAPTTPVDLPPVSAT